MKVFDLGRLATDPELRQTNNGTEVAEFTFVVDDGYGENKHSSFFRIVAFGKNATNVDKFLQKGQQVFIEGEMKQEDWQDKDGNKRSSYKVYLSTFKFVSGQRSGGGQQQQQQQSFNQQPQQRSQQAQPDGDEIPF